LRQKTHRRIPTITANLLIAFGFWLEYAQEAEAISAMEARRLRFRGRDAIEEAANAQTEHQQASEPTQRFLELLTAALASGRAHVANDRGDHPGRPEAWGWRSVTISPNTSQECADWRAQGERVGWLVGDDDLYLEPEAAFTAVQKFARDGGESLPIGSKTLHKRLDEKGLLASKDAGRRKLTTRKVLEGSRRVVLHLRASLVAPPPPRDEDQ
jgi:hypothetical protein